MPVQDTNNFVITGIPRSGTSLLCNLVNHIENIVCFNEITPFYAVDNLPHTFHHMRSEIKKGSPVPIKISKNTGQEITDTQGQEFTHEFVEPGINPEKKLAVGSKINVPYLLQIEKILSYGYKVIFVVRDPVYTIASWNKHENINEQYVMDEDFEKWPRYKNFKFKSRDRIGRQIELYKKLMEIIKYDAKTYWDILIYTYEQIVEETEGILTEICGLLEIGFFLKKKLPELKNMNRDSRFSDINLDEIRMKLKEV